MSSLSLVGCLLNSEQYFPRNQESDVLSLKTFFQLVHIHVNQKTKKEKALMQYRRLMIMYCSI